VKLQDIQSIIWGMNHRYGEFWRSLTPYPAREPVMHTQKQALECDDWGTLPCAHVEMDLMERFRRIGSRPLIFLDQDGGGNGDYDSVGRPRTEAQTCLPSDDSCLLLHAERLTPPIQWDINGVDAASPAMDALRQSIRNVTLPPPLGTVPPANMPYRIAPGALLPSFDVPLPIDLLPAQ
jgi:hypothetical protein